MLYVLGPGAANAHGMEQNAKVYPVTKATVEEITEDDAPGHISDAATEDVTPPDAAAHHPAAVAAAAADSPGIDAADSTPAAVKDDAYTSDAAAETLHSGASIVSSETASVGMPASSSANSTAREGLSNIANSSEGLKQSSIGGNSAEQTAAALDPTAPSEDMVGATQSADALARAQPHKAAAVAEGIATRTDQNGSVRQHLATATLSAERGLSAVVLNQTRSLPVVRLALTVDDISESPAVQVALTVEQGSPAELVGHTSSGPTEAVAAEPTRTASLLAAMHPIAALEHVPSSEPLALPATEQEKFIDITAGPAADTADDAAEQFIGLASLPLDSDSTADDATASHIAFDPPATELVSEGKSEVHAAATQVHPSKVAAVCPTSSEPPQSAAKKEDTARFATGLSSEVEVADPTECVADGLLGEAAAVSMSSGGTGVKASGSALGWKSVLLLSVGGGLVVYAAAKCAGRCVYDTHHFPT